MKYSANLGLLWTELKIDEAIHQAKKIILMLLNSGFPIMKIQMLSNRHLMKQIYQFFV